MGGIGNFLDSFKSGPTKPGMWGDLEEFGRFEGTGELSAELELPESHVAISVEDYKQVEDLELTVTGPGGTEPELKRYTSRDFGPRDAVHQLYRIRSGKLHDAGLYHLSVTAPAPDQHLMIMVGRETTVGGEVQDMAKEMVPGRKLWKRLRGE